MHGLFQGGAARAAILAGRGARSSGRDHPAVVDEALDELAAQLAHCLDIDAIARIAGL